VLQGDERAVLHTKEAVERLARDAEWGVWLSAAADIINAHTKVRIASVIDIAAHTKFAQDWRRRMPRSLQPETAYSFGVTTCLAEMAAAAQEAGYDDWITYVIEEGHPNYGQVRVILDDIKKQPEPRRNLRLWTYAAASKADYIELQACDFFAYWIREYAEAVNFRGGEPDRLHPLAKRLLAATHAYVYWDAERFARYLDHQEKAQQDAAREWWRSKMRSDRRRRDQQ
jgi:hypothetical protein